MENMTLDTMKKEMEKFDLESNNMTLRTESIIVDIEDKIQRILPLLRYVKSEKCGVDGLMSEWAIGDGNSHLIIKSHRDDLTQIHRLEIFINNVGINSSFRKKFISLQQAVIDYRRAFGHKKYCEDTLKIAEELEDALSKALSNPETSE